MARRSRDCFYGGAAAGAADQEKRRGTQEDGPQQLQQPGQGPMMQWQQPGQGPMMIILSGISAGYVIL